MAVHQCFGECCLVSRARVVASPLPRPAATVLSAARTRPAESCPLSSAARRKSWPAGGQGFVRGAHKEGGRGRGGREAVFRRENGPTERRLHTLPFLFPFVVVSAAAEAESISSPVSSSALL